MAPPFEEIAATCLEACEQEGSTALDRFGEEYPEHADQLRELVRHLVSTGLIETGDNTKDRPQAGSFPERLGGFRLLERIGMGGMGVVFRAEQESLGRQVALKLIRPDYMFFPGARDRLRREVEAVARLDHPGIVSILTVGDESETPYFAMEFVHGCSVAQVLQETEGRDPRSLSGSDMHAIVRRLSRAGSDLRESSGPPNLYQGSWAHTCTRITRQVAEALHHAHHRGIIHRDVKPSNIMLTPNGRVLVVDFGLALLQAAPKLTQSGSTLGSLAYMAPEQIRGGHPDARFDVYSLGVSLYEMLTLKPAFDGGNAAELQQRILDARFTPPRLLNSSVSRDLETVCLTAMSRERSSRYASPAALSEELANVLELRPVRARRPGAVLRSLRWVQRHKAVSTAISLGLLLTVGTPFTLWWQQRSANTEIQSALTEARQNFDKSLEAGDNLLARVCQTKLKHVPRVTKVRGELTEDTFKFYEGLLAGKPNDPELLRRTAVASFEVGKMSLAMGRPQKAREAFAHSLARWTAIVQPSMDDEESRGHVLIHYSATMNAVGETESALEVARKAEALAKTIRQRTVGPRTRRRLRMMEAVGVRCQAMALHSMNKVAESSAVFSRAIEMLRLLVQDRPEERVIACELARTQIGAANLYEENRQPDKAEPLFVDAVKHLDGIVGLVPRNQDVKGLLVHALNGVSRLATNSMRHKDAEPPARRASKLADSLATDYPAIVKSHSHRAVSHHNLAVARLNQGDAAEARLHLEVAREAASTALQLNPDLDLMKHQIWASTRAACMATYRLQDHRALSRLARSLTGLRKDQVTQHGAAECFALALELVQADGSLAKATKRRLVQQLAKEALDCLERAVKAGLRGDQHFRTRGLWRLRGQQRFRELRHRATLPEFCK